MAESTFNDHGQYFRKLQHSSYNFELELSLHLILEGNYGCRNLGFTQRFRVAKDLSSTIEILLMACLLYFDHLAFK